MKELIKIKMSDKDQLDWPLFLQESLKRNEDFTLTIEPERKLCEMCDYLEFSEGSLYYHSNELGKMSFDLEELSSYHQRQHYAISKEPLAKALGIKGRNDSQQEKLSIWDTTCGTGKDTTLIYHFGAKITAFERNPVVYLLLQDALRRFPMDLTLNFGDASRLNVSENMRPQVIYYDPMYPSKKKSALPRKEMRIFKEIVGDDPDSKEFLEWALKTAAQRVVVKRPLEADPILPKPTASYEGKSTRYDMYKIF
jgi:16S rRNA (guanine1516-N2)-methyltransferase